MDVYQILGMLVWTIAGGVLLFALMWVDSLFTRYKDISEMKNGNVAVATRFVMKLFAQGYILAQSISKSNDLWIALLVSVVSFVILFILEFIAERTLKRIADFDLDQGTKDGSVAAALLAGSFHVVGALIVGAYL